MSDPDALAVDIKIPTNADPGDVAEGLMGILAALICSMSQTRRQARDGAKEAGKDLLNIVSELWDENTGAPH